MSPAEVGSRGDSLTGLGDHRAFQRCLAENVRTASESGEALSLAMLDVDRLKFFNDCFGYSEGDEILAHIAVTLEAASPRSMAFRIGGDEFALVMPGVAATDAAATIERCAAAVSSRDVSALFTTGVATLSATDDGDFAVLSERASCALHEGKQRSRGTVVSFESVADSVTVVTAAKVSALCALLDEPRLDIAFQPIWNLASDCLLGVEALARPWSGYGFSGPAEMFVIAEKIGRAHELDAICVSAALARAHEIPQGALLFLNVNPQALVHDVVTGASLMSQVLANGLRPNQVVIEITERSEARLDEVVARAAGLADLGFQLAIDDVGVGNAGIEMLCELPVNFLKIDRSIIAKVLTSVQARAVFISMALFAYRVDAHVITEGIETVEVFNFITNAHHLDIMRDPPITGAQGFLLGRPSIDLSGLPPCANDALVVPAPPKVTYDDDGSVHFADAA